MKQIVKTEENKIDIDSFEPMVARNKIKPIGFINQFGKKGFIMQLGYMGDEVVEVALDGMEFGNKYARYKKEELKENIKCSIDRLDYYVFENSQELIEWLANK